MAIPVVHWQQLLRDAVAAPLTSYAATLPPDASYLSASGSTQLFVPYDNGSRHGNFCDASYTSILANPDWEKRLQKPHTRRKSLPAPHNLGARELDSSNSSDALLMNVFCYPGVMASPLIHLLEVGSTALPQFGFAARVPLDNGHFDQTEVDLKLEDLLIEAKFTEKDFTQQREAIVYSYADLEAVFDVDALPRVGTDFESYQLIRNVLAAHHHKCRFWLLCDVRRPDLMRAWWTIYGAIRLPHLRARCGLVLWQQIAAVVPTPLAAYLRQSRAIC